MSAFGHTDADSPDDPSGKHYKSSQQHSRKEIVYAVLLTGVCIGFVTAQHLYMHHQRWEEQVPTRQLPQSAPRSELEGILQRIAPDREVMIAISNYNLILQGMLTTWLQVGMAICISAVGDQCEITVLVPYVCVHDADGGQSPSFKLPGGCN